jgi:hypothetical protein
MTIIGSLETQTNLECNTQMYISSLTMVPIILVQSTKHNFKAKRRSYVAYQWQERIDHEMKLITC